MDAEIFNQVLDQLSNDRFLTFVRQFVTSRVICHGLPTHNASGKVQRLDWASTSEFTNDHFECFGVYKQLFESRVRATLNRTNFSEREFASLCEGVLLKGETKGADEDSDAVSAYDLCEAVLQMLHCVSDFQSFAAMMRETQLELAASDSDSEGDEAVRQSPP